MGDLRSAYGVVHGVALGLAVWFVFACWVVM
jgi:hypothetical protein